MAPATAKSAFAPDGVPVIQPPPVTEPASVTRSANATTTASTIPTLKPIFFLIIELLSSDNAKQPRPVNSRSQQGRNSRCNRGPEPLRGLCASPLKIKTVKPQRAQRKDRTAIHPETRSSCFVSAL